MTLCKTGQIINSIFVGDPNLFTFSSFFLNLNSSKYWQLIFAVSHHPLLVEELLAASSCSHRSSFS
jgi:hypothetical protein